MPATLTTSPAGPARRPRPARLFDADQAATLRPDLGAADPHAISDDAGHGGDAAAGISLGTVETNRRQNRKARKKRAPALTDQAEWAPWLGGPGGETPWLGVLPDGRRLVAIENPTPDPERRRFDVPTATPAELEFRHSGWEGRRQRVRAALAAAHVPARRLDAFDNCGGGCWIFLDAETDEAKACGTYCHDRFCLPCARARSRVLIENLTARIEPGDYLHVVLTVRNEAGELRPRLDHLYKSFAKLCRTKQWKKWTDGGAAVVEVKLGERSGHWHPHLHVVTKGKLKNGRGQAKIPHAELSALWLKITGDSDNVWITRVLDARGAAEEIATYVAKPIHRQLVETPGALVELVTALRGRRLCLTFGAWRGWPLLDPPENPDAGRWFRFGSLVSVMARAAAGDAKCQRILFQLDCLADPERKGSAIWDIPPPPLSSG